MDSFGQGFLVVFFILLLAGVMYYVIYHRRKRQVRELVDDLVAFNTALNRNDIPMINELGMSLVYNMNLTKTILDQLSEEVDKRKQNYPVLDELSNVIMNKKLDMR